MQKIVCWCSNQNITSSFLYVTNLSWRQFVTLLSNWHFSSGTYIISIGVNILLTLGFLFLQAVIFLTIAYNQFIKYFVFKINCISFCIIISYFIFSELRCPYFKVKFLLWKDFSELHFHVLSISRLNGELWCFMLT